MDSPCLDGKPLRIRFQPALAVRGGELISNSGKGRAVHAATYIRRREIVLDEDLKSRPLELTRILVHELCHFGWVRLGNPRRRSWENLVAGELRSQTRGEMGWSAEVRKQALRRADWTRRTRRWREYACESFCDTGAWLLAGLRGHPEFTLARAARAARRRWFRDAGLFERLSV